MKKTKLFIDYDNTIVNSTKAFCETYNDFYKNEDGFVPASWQNSIAYNFTDECPLLNGDHDKIIEIFESDHFFNIVELINDNTKHVLQYLDDKFEIHICSIGSRENVYRKHKWMNKNLSFLSRYIFITNDNCTMDKSIINMDDSIFIDDHIDNLNSSNASLKISFGKRTDCNMNWEGEICETWSDVSKLLYNTFG